MFLTATVAIGQPGLSPARRGTPHASGRPDGRDLVILDLGRRRPRAGILATDPAWWPSVYQRPANCRIGPRSRALGSKAVSSVTWLYNAVSAQLCQGLGNGRRSPITAVCRSDAVYTTSQ